MTIGITGSSAPPPTFPREQFLALLHWRSQDFDSTEARTELFAGLGVSADLPVFSQGDLESQLGALVDYLSDPARLETALRLARRVATRAGLGGDAEPLVKALEDLHIEHRARSVEAGAAPDLGTLHEWLGLECVHFYSLSDRFFGREAELRVLDAWVAEPESAVGVRCICALGGGGKSALAWHWISRASFRQLGYRGVFWCSFYEKNFDFPEFLRRSLEWCGHASPEESKRLTRSEMERRLLKVLADEPFVLVLDGLERLMNGYAIVFDRAVDPDAVRAGKHEADVAVADRQLTDPRSGAFLKRLARAMRSKVVVTTRLAPAELEDDTGVEVPGAKFMTLGGLAPAEVAQLWDSVLPKSPIDSEVEAIFALCDNHPLVVSVLARSAARAGGWTAWRSDARHGDFVPPAAASAMEARAHVIGTCLRDLDERSYDVLGALTTSGKPMLLSLLAQILIGSSELAGDRRWTSDAQVRAELDALVSLGLVGATNAGESPEYDVHPVVRGAVWSLLTDARGERHLRHALSEFFATPDRKDPSDGIDLNKAISLFRLLVQSQEIDRAWEMYFNKLWWPLAFINDNRTLLDLFELLLPTGDPLQLLPLASRREQANSCDVLGTLLMQAGDRDVSQRLLRWCGAIRLQIGDFLGFLDARHSRTWQTMYEGRLFDAELELRQMRIQAEHFDAGEIRHIVECWIGLTLALRGQKEAALRQFRLAKGQITSHRWWAQGLAEGYVYLEEPEQALVWLDEAAATAAPLAEGRAQEAWELVTRGMAQFQKKQWDAAEDSLVKALEHAVRSNYAIVQCFATPYIAQIFLERGDLAEAESRIESYFRLDEHGTYALAATDAWRVRALCALARGDRAKAVACATRAYRLAACDGPPFTYEAGLRRALATLEKAGAYAPQADARLVPTWKDELERLEAAAAADGNAGEKEPDEGQRRVAAPLTAEEARRRLAEFAVMREASEHDRRWWQEVTKDTPIAIEFRLGRAIETYGITLERFREAYEASTHKSVLVTFSQLQAESLIYPQRPQPVGSLDDAGQREWLARTDEHKRALDSFLQNAEFAARVRTNFEVHEFDDIGVRAFLQDARRRIGFDTAGLGKEWWSQLERVALPIDVLILAESIFWSGSPLDELVAAIAANADRGIEYAFLSIRVQRAIAELESPSVSRTEGWSDLQIVLRLRDVKRRLGWNDASEPAREFWTAFEQRNGRDLARVLRLAEELAVRRATIDEYYRAYFLSNTDHVEANLSYLDYSRLKGDEWSADVSLLDEVGRSATGRSVTALTFSNTKEWADEQLASRLGALKERLGWESASEEIRSWWLPLEPRYGLRVAIRLAEELDARRAQISDLHLAHVDGGTDHLPAAFAYLDYTRVKAEQEEKARQRASAHEEQAREHVVNKRYRDAAASYLAAVREAPFESEYYINAADALAETTDDTRPAAIAEGIQILERGVARCPGAAMLYSKLCGLQKKRADVDEIQVHRHATDVLERGIGRCPTVGSLYVELADLLQQTANAEAKEIRDLAIDVLERGIAHVPVAGGIYRKYAALWEHAVDIGRDAAFQNAIAVLERGVRVAQIRRDELETLQRRRTFGTLADEFGDLDGAVPWVAPLAVEIADDLVRFVDSKQDNGLFLEKIIPAMKERVQAAFAIKLPGLRLRGSPYLAPGGFRVLLHEVPLVDGSLSSGSAYVLAADARAAGVTIGTEIVDPMTDQPCLMVEPADAERLQKAGVSVWQVPHFFIRQLERILTHYLHHFADVQSVSTVLKAWRADGHGDLIDRKLPTASDRIAFCRMFRALLRDGIHISPRETFPTVVLGALPDPPHPHEVFAETLATMRVNLRRFLAGNLPGVEHVMLPPEFQERLRGLMGRLDAEAHMRLLEDLREYVRPAAARRRALVVSEPATRAWLQRLLEPVYPTAKVMTTAEVQEEAVVFA